MGLKIERADVWAASIPDAPGGLAKVLAELKGAGANLEFVIARRAADKPGSGVVFLTPLSDEGQINAAGRVGFKPTSSVHSVKVEGPNVPGIGAELTAKLAAAGLNLRGLSAAVVGDRFVMYIGLDSAADADKACEVLRGA